MLYIIITPVNMHDMHTYIYIPLEPLRTSTCGLCHGCTRIRPDRYCVYIVYRIVCIYMCMYSVNIKINYIEFVV